MLQYTQITGSFEDGQGNPLSGTATFVPNVTVYAAGVPVLEANVPIVAQIIAGALRSPTGGTLQLLATDNAGLTFEGQTGFLCYSVTIVISGETLPAWQFFLPHTPSPVDLFSLANTPPTGGGGITPPAGDIGGSTSAPTVVSTHLSVPLPLVQGGTGAASQQAAINALTGTQSAGKYLRSDGTNAALTTIQAGDVPSLPYVPTSSLPLAIGSGGTGQATQQAAMDALAGAVTTGDYLRGNGTHVQMAAILAADLPAATTSTQGAVVLDGTAADMQPAGVAAAGAKGQAADAKHVHPFQPWQFAPEAYGAKGDGKVIADATIAGGSLSTLTSASAGFTSADTGKRILVNDAGPGNLPLCTTITYVSATTVTLGTAASGAVTGAAAFYATDDTAAIGSAITAAKTYALANGYFAEILFAAKFYGVAGAPTQTGDGSTVPTFNAQIPLPYPAANGAGQKLVIALTGAGDGSQCQYWESAVPNLQGTCLVSMVQAPAQPDATFGWQSVIGGPSGAAGFTGGFANTKAVITGITVFTPLISHQYAYDLRYCGGMRVDKCSAQAFASVAGGIIPLPNMPALTSFQSAGSVGLYAPVIGNNDDVYAGSFAAEGFSTGVQADDHFTALRLACIYANIGLELNSLGAASGVSHRVTIANYSAEASNAAISCNGGTMPVDISMTAEVVNTADVQDNSNGLLGVIRWYSESVAAPAVQGGAKVKIVNDNLGPGHWSGAPAVPASTTAQQNTAWRDAAVTITGGTVTVITVDGTATGLTSGTVIVPGGKNITLTYSAAPSWVWTLL